MGPRETTGHPAERGHCSGRRSRPPAAACRSMLGKEARAGGLHPQAPGLLPPGLLGLGHPQLPPAAAHARRPRLTHVRPLRRPPHPDAGPPAAPAVRARRRTPVAAVPPLPQVRPHRGPGRIHLPLPGAGQRGHRQPDRLDRPAGRRRPGHRGRRRKPAGDPGGMAARGSGRLDPRAPPGLPRLLPLLLAGHGRPLPSGDGPGLVPAAPRLHRREHRGLVQPRLPGRRRPAPRASGTHHRGGLPGRLGPGNA